MKLNFSINEFIKSDLALKNNINNMPDLKSLDNILKLIFYCLQPLRNLIKKPIIITSGYRCEKLNALARGKKNSQHKNGEAVDFIVKGIEPSKIIEIIKNSNIEFDQLINEYNSWVHLSYSEGKNRNQIIKY